MILPSHCTLWLLLVKCSPVIRCILFMQKTGTTDINSVVIFLQKNWKIVLLWAVISPDCLKLINAKSTPTKCCAKVIELNFFGEFQAWNYRSWFTLIQTNGAALHAGLLKLICRFPNLFAIWLLSTVPLCSVRASETCCVISAMISIKVCCEFKRFNVQIKAVKMHVCPLCKEIVTGRVKITEDLSNHCLINNYF